MRKGYGNPKAKLPHQRGYRWADDRVLMKREVPAWVARGVEKIRGRLAELEKVRASYLQYLNVRISEQDWHGAWDASCNISETTCEEDGLRFALRAFGYAD